MTTTPFRLTLAAGLLALAGCGSAPDTTSPAAVTPEGAPAVAAPADPLRQCREVLRENPGIEGCKSALQYANAHLAANPAARAPALSDADRDSLKARWELTDAEVAEIAAPEFTRLDAYYLDESLLLRDAARSLGVDGRPAAERATAAFAWVGREVAPAPAAGYVAPPAFTARRGWGSTPERVGVQLALLRQLGLDAALLGKRQPDGLLKIVAIGVRDGDRFLLYDHEACVPVPGTGGTPLTLAEARSDAKVPEGDALRADLRDSAVWQAPPLSGLAPRQAALERLLEPTGRVRLVVSGSPADLIPAAAGAEVKGATVSAGRAGLMHVLPAFLPPEEGGFEPPPSPTNPLKPRRVRWVSELIPWSGFPVALGDDALPGALGQTFRKPILEAFVEVLAEPHQPRELILRGRFAEAERLLAEQRERTREAGRKVEAVLADVPEARRSAELDRRATEWFNKLRSAAARNAGAEREARERPGTAEADLQAARIELRAVQDDPGAALATLMVNRVKSDLLVVELTWELALCKHEQAARNDALARAGSPEAPSADRRLAAWRDAENWWSTWRRQYARDLADADPEKRERAARRLVHESRYTQALKLGAEARARANGS